MDDGMTDAADVTDVTAEAELMLVTIRLLFFDVRPFVVVDADDVDCG